MTTRRTFIKQSALFSAAAFVTPSSLLKVNKRIGLQLYTLRGDIAKDPATVIKSVAAIGYKEVESFGYNAGKYFGMAPKDFAALLKSNGLAHPSSHYMLANLSGNWQKAVEDAVAAGQKYMVVAYLLDTERKSIDDYKKIAAQFNTAAETCKKAGIQFGYHNHDFEFIDMDGRHGFDVLLKETDPKLVQFELDLYWASFAGKDPVEMFQQHPGRFPLWHVKDMDNTPKRFFTEVGNGVIDFKKIFAHAKASGMQHYFVEQDVCPGPPIKSIEKSYQYISKNLVG
ncbi:sugar phosphate isomerase/epimerase [Agriterribacter sp.]|uniref:sugar phosphate isomerase/epimerase family protein n=1 Tax=Agriterribacter sp. TaxID=2821509 RepID=UPI002D0015D5|nr:sugar phosphate isomerase/epimerase [Agriterribacter sp.]HTN07070.1 sugar phosphate isomerase/epimerase [Agriterribacter sp.]